MNGRFGEPGAAADRAAPDRTGAAFERRSAALIAYLALEGPTARSKLAGLLWPDASEATARNNLSQTLRRLRQSGAGPELLGDDVLRLAASPQPDAALALLRPHDYDDLPDFDDWRLAVQERRRAAQVAHLRGEVRQRDAAGDLRPALDLAEVWLDLDPVSEDAYRHLMRLHHLLGDRAGALSAYHRCQAALRRELGLGPGPETVRLAREVERSPLPSAPSRALPLSVQRPPRLVGRAAAWEAMERAWDEGKGVILSGAPGVGKTRLLRDFMAAHGQRVVFQGRPGDRLVPYSTHARTYAELLRQFPALVLPDWVRRELARIVPGLGEAPPPIASDAEKLRFYQAKAEVLQLAARAGMGALALDDLQCVDPASVEAGEHSLASFWGDEGTGLRTIHAYRTGELSAELEGRIDALVSAGLAVRVHLAPLSAAEVGELLESLDLPEVQVQARGIALASGGNPLVVLETVRHLLSQQDGAALSGRLPTLLGERLARLSPAAVSLARAAAVLGADFGPEAAAAMLGTAVLDLASAWQELEAAQVLAGSAFTHDLLAEAVGGGLPGVLREVLHRRAAAALESLGSAPARIAGHWQAGGDVRRAAPHWLAAAEEATHQFRRLEAAALFDRAADAFEREGDPEAAINALERQSKSLLEADYGARHEAVVARIERLARTPLQRARAHRQRAQLQNRQRDMVAAETSARAGLALLGEAGEEHLRAELLDIVALSQWNRGELEAAAENFMGVAALLDGLGLRSEQAEAINNLALVLDFQGRRSEAARCYAQVERLFAELGQKDNRAIVLSNWGGSLSQGGRHREAASLQRRALALCQELQGTPNIERRTRTQLGAALTALGDYAEAEAQLSAALELAQAHKLPLAYVRTALGDLCASLGRFRQAQDHLALAAEEHTGHAELAITHLAQARALVLQGRDPSPALDRAGQHLGQGGLVTLRLRWRLWQTRQAAPAQALEAALSAVNEAQALEHGGLEACAHVHAAQVLLALGRADAALGHAEQADQLLMTFSAIDLPWAEAALARVAALEALNDPAALQVRASARGRLLREADEQLAHEDRDAFLALPLHRALLDDRTEATAWRPLTDAQWLAVEELLSAQTSGTGRPRRDTRLVLDGVRWALATGTAWNRPFPAHLPSAATCYRRYREWQAQGVLIEVRRRLGEPGA